MQTNQTITIGFAGDVMLGRLVNEVISKEGYAYPWGNMLSALQSTDLNIANLETTLTKSIQKVPKVFNYKADPEKVKSLKIADIDVVNLANNHMLDFGNEGLAETITTLDQAGIKHVGAGINKQQAQEPVVVEKNGIKVGILGYSDYPKDWAAQENKPGTNLIKIGDIETIKNAISKLRIRY